METYRQVRVGLFIGLLGLNTLSACVNTSKQLMNRLTSGAMPNHATGVVNAPLSALNNKYGGSMGTISGTSPNMNAPTANFIVDALQNGDKKWGDGVPQVANPMILEDHITEDLARHGYAPERIAYWINEKELDINAKDNLGRTLLMHAVKYQSEHAIKWIVEQGGDVNMQIAPGLTALYFAVHQLKRSKIDEKIIYLLLELGADPRILTKRGNSALSFAEEYAESRYTKPDMRKSMKKISAQMKKNKKRPVRARG